MVTKSTVDVIVVSICVSLAFSETQAEFGFLCNKMHACSEMPVKLADYPLMSQLQKIDTVFSPKR